MKKFLIPNKLLAAGVGLLLLASCSDDEAIPLYEPDFSGGGTEINYTWAATADSLQQATYNTFLGSNGTFVQDNAGTGTFHYWPNAHMLDVLNDGYLRTGDNNYATRMKALLRGIKARNGNTYNNDFNDDMIWLANSSLRAFKSTNDPEYKAVALELWTIIKRSWTTNVLDGGITWKQSTPTQKNAVSNAPAAIIALQLYEIDRNPDDLEWAVKIYAWQKQKLVDPLTGLVWDSISIRDGQVFVQRDWVFTYNMGTWIGAGLKLYKATGNQMYLTDAIRSARSVSTSPQLLTEGLMKDEGQGDGGLFKGTLVRYYTELILAPEINSSDRENFANFIEFNAKTAYRRGIARPAMMFGPNWKNAPTGTTDFTTQLSGVMLIEAAALLHEEGHID
jgi:predicted alpha-1,6-mannanase (GH76 family)